MTNPTKPASGGPKKNQPGKGPAGGTGPGKGSTAMGKGSAGSTAGKGPANRAQSKKIVNQRQTPWGLIIATTLIVALAVGVIGYAVSQNKKKSDAKNPDKIAGIVHKTFTGGDHKTGPITYAESPPMGGPHSGIWADCEGTVYPTQIASENAVHGLEHGAVWITYKPGLPADQLEVLNKLTAGKPYTLLTPYDGLKSNVSLQAWGYQLFVDSATDKRVERFIEALRQSQTNTPELGASCSNPPFKANPSTPGKPTES
ncbi:MAG TPA: DUF3105 domain-containing protein [Jatrophihabitans sp.]|jgi:hypothetical protein|uniref:DUF3105 domain-containing protein n=1 Tax=Jatrophihabitans sp. TaxID=1932789 RepID=UPI002F0F22A4